jgi:para-nitrobenzyl esterase
MRANEIFKELQHMRHHAADTVSLTVVFALMSGCSGAEHAPGPAAGNLPTSSGIAGGPGNSSQDSAGKSGATASSQPAAVSSQPTAGSRASMPSGAGAPAGAMGAAGSGGAAGTPGNDATTSPQDTVRPAPVCEKDAASSDPCRACVHQGRLAGRQNGSTCQYLGIPYANPTSGERRFMPPEPASGWSEIRQATDFGPACPQVPDVSFASSTSEDCLSLNVYAPTAALSARSPVMVFIHGGGYATGASNIYGGRGLSELGRVVVVTMNYRLGLLAFFAHPDLDRERPDAPSGADAIRDQQLALRWVRENIASFGGDPDNVTLFGESAGAAAVSVHLVSPGSRGLVRRFVMESGASTKGPGNGIAPVSRESMYSITRRMVTELCPDATDSIACLRALPTEKLLQWSPTTTATGAGSAAPGSMFVPVIEGPGGVMPEDPDTLMKSGRFNPGEILIGTNKNEYGLFQQLSSDTIDTLQQLRTVVEQRFGASADEIMGLYAPAGTEPNQAYVTLMTDIMFRCPSRRLARFAQAQGTPVYLYSFEVGQAQHANELLYVFGPDNLADGLVGPFSTIFPAQLVDAMQRYWINFAYSGDPNGQRLAVWPRYSAATDQHMVLADPLSTGSGLQREACDFWDRYIDRP